MAGKSEASAQGVITGQAARLMPLVMFCFLLPAFMFCPVGVWAKGIYLQDRNIGGATPLPAPQQRGNNSAGSTFDAAIATPATVNGNVLLTEHFRIIWGDTFDGADPEWQTGAGGNPIWIERIAAAAESSYITQTSLGFPAPYGNSVYYTDIIVADTGAAISATAGGAASSVALSPGQDSTLYGYTEINANFSTTVIVINDDFSQLILDGQTELDLVDATIAHELFHGVQRNYYPWDDEVLVPDAVYNLEERWWIEATATWMEEVCFPDVNDYVGYVGVFLASPQSALMLSADGLRPYGASVFAGYLWNTQGGAAFFIDVFDTAYNGSTPGGDLVDSLEGALVTSSAMTLGETVAEFWGHAIDPASPGSPWPDGPLFVSGAPTARAASTSASSLAFATNTATAPRRYGANLLSFVDDGADKPLVISNISPAGSTLIMVENAGGVVLASAAADSVETTLVTRGAPTARTVAVVNTSDQNGQADYSLVLGNPDQGGAGESSGGGGGGGCFIDALSTGMP